MEEKDRITLKLTLGPLTTLWDLERFVAIARRRIAAHETAKILLHRPGYTGALNWWDCHPNPKRGHPLWSIH